MSRAGRRIVLFWALLVIATLCSVELLAGAGAGIGPRTAGVLVLLIALVKVRIVALEFMELRHGPLALRLAFYAWLVLLGAALVVLYALQPA